MTIENVGIDEAGAAELERKGWVLCHICDAWTDEPENHPDFEVEREPYPDHHVYSLEVTYGYGPDR